MDSIVPGNELITRIEQAIQRLEEHKQSESRDRAIESLTRKLILAKQGESFVCRDVTKDWIRAFGGEIAKLTKGTLLRHHIR